MFNMIASKQSKNIVQTKTYKTNYYITTCRVPSAAAVVHAKLHVYAVEACNLHLCITSVLQLQRLFTTTKWCYNSRKPNPPSSTPGRCCLCQMRRWVQSKRHRLWFSTKTCSCYLTKTYVDSLILSSNGI